MKKLILILLLLSAATAQAVPAFPKLITFRQPADGGTVSIYLKGDERVHWAETEDGYSLLHRDDGSLVFAMSNDKGDMIPSSYLAADKEQRSPEVVTFLSTIPQHLHYSRQQVDDLKKIWSRIEDAKQGPKTMSDVIGTKKFLVILFEFSDQSFSHNASEFDALMNQVNYTTGGLTGSVRDYYYDVSGGLFTLNMDVVGPFKGTHNTAFYGNTDYGYQYFAREAVDSAAKYVNFANYDNDGDGYIDGLHIIFAGHGEEAGASVDCIWSHKWNIFDPPQYNNTIIDVYSCSPECGGSNGNSITHIGVICHELGHVFGAPDYYDTDYGSSGGEFPGLGQWDIMSSGSWNRNGITPAHHNPYTKIYIYHWATCATLTNTAAQYVMDPVAESLTDYYRVNTSTNGDFFLLENRQQIKWDEFIPGHGLLVYHAHPNISGSRVDNSSHPQQLYILARSSAQYPNSTPASYGSVNSNQAPFPGDGDLRDTLTDNSVPWFRPWSHQPNNLPLYNISDDPSTGKLYFSVQDVSPDPFSAMAEGIDIDKILISWERYGTKNTLILRSDSPDNFTEPYANLHTGDTLANGNIVCYIGNGYRTVVSDLQQNGHYYFKLFTRRNNGNFSDGIVIDGTTLDCMADDWRTEDFESTGTGNMPECWTGDWTVNSIDGNKALSCNTSASGNRSWHYTTSRPMVYGTTAQRVLRYRARFLEGCSEQSRISVEYQANAYADWSIADSMTYGNAAEGWNSRYLVIDNIGDYSRLRFAILTDGTDKAAIDDIEVSDSWLCLSTADQGGTIEPLGYATAPWGDSIEYIIRPNGGYKVHRLTYDTRVVLASRLTPRGDGSFSYKVAAAEGLHHIKAMFNRNNSIEQASENAVTAYPNPTSGLLTVACTPGSSISLYDTRGSRVMHLTARSENNTIDMQHMPKGIYILHCDKSIVKVVKK